MSDEKILGEVNLSSFLQTGGTVHRQGGIVLPKAASLRLVQFGGDSSVYLIHYDAEGKEMTDTCHETIDEAVGQAEFEYGVRKEHWALSR
jgi:hypothetical protein